MPLLKGPKQRDADTDFVIGTNSGVPLVLMAKHVRHVFIIYLKGIRRTSTSCDVISYSSS